MGKKFQNNLIKKKKKIYPPHPPLPKTYVPQKGLILSSMKGGVGRHETNETKQICLQTDTSQINYIYFDPISNLLLL